MANPTARTLMVFAPGSDGLNAFMEICLEIRKADGFENAAAKVIRRFSKIKKSPTRRNNIAESAAIIRFDVLNSRAVRKMPIEAPPNKSNGMAGYRYGKVTILLLI